MNATATRTPVENVNYWLSRHQVTTDSGHKAWRWGWSADVPGFPTGTGLLTKADARQAALAAFAQA